MTYLDELAKTPASFRILRYLYEKGETKLTGFIGSVAGQRGIYAAIGKLLQFGLIRERKGTKFPYSRLFSLTDAGKKVAKDLCIIDAAVNQSVSLTVNKPK